MSTVKSYQIGWIVVQYGELQINWRKPLIEAIRLDETGPEEATIKLLSKDFKYRNLNRSKHKWITGVGLIWCILHLCLAAHWQYRKRRNEKLFLNQVTYSCQVHCSGGWFVYGESKHSWDAQKSFPLYHDRHTILFLSKTWWRKIGNVLLRPGSMNFRGEFWLAMRDVTVTWHIRLFNMCSHWCCLSKHCLS